MNALNGSSRNKINLIDLFKVGSPFLVKPNKPKLRPRHGTLMANKFIVFCNSTVFNSAVENAPELRAVSIPKFHFKIVPTHQKTMLPLLNKQKKPNLVKDGRGMDGIIEKFRCRHMSITANQHSIPKIKQNFKKLIPYHTGSSLKTERPYINKMADVPMNYHFEVNKDMGSRISPWDNNITSSSISPAEA